MDDSVLAEVYLPAMQQALDIWLPTSLPVHELVPLIGRAAASYFPDAFAADEDAVLCDRESGRVYSPAKTPADLGFENGARLMLM